MTNFLKFITATTATSSSNELVVVVVVVNHLLLLVEGAIDHAGKNGKCK